MDALRGTCLCADIQYEVTLPLLDAGFCHCTLCRKASGAPTVAWGTVRREKLRVVRGVPHTYASSPRAERVFCGHCGSPLFFRYTPDSETVDFTLGSLLAPEQVSPQYHIWTSTQIPWMRHDDTLPRFTDSGPDKWI